MNSLKTHIRGALGNGATREEIVEVLLHMTVYGGFPDAWDGLAVAREVFAQQDAEQEANVEARALRDEEREECIELWRAVWPGDNRPYFRRYLLWGCGVAALLYAGRCR